MMTKKKFVILEVELLVLAQDVTWQLRPVESVMVDGQVSRTMHLILVGSLEDQRPELVARKCIF